MKTVELFAGTESFSKIAKSKGYEVFTVEYDASFNPDMIHDLLQDMPELLKEKIAKADIIWMSPPCTTFSMAAGNTHWTVDKMPKTQKAIDGLKLLLFCKGIAEYCETANKVFFIENPRARARWFLPDKWRKTVWYCQYGDSRAKPTDIWTNLQGWTPKTCCNNSQTCHHEKAPRGSKTGTQGLKDAKNRSVIPPKLFEEIFNILGVGKTNKEE